MEKEPEKVVLVYGPDAEPPKMKVYKITCTVCGAETGNITLPEEHPIDVDNAVHADFGIDDSRCDEHS